MSDDFINPGFLQKAITGRRAAYVSQVPLAGTEATMTRLASGTEDDGWFFFEKAGSVVGLVLAASADVSAGTFGAHVEKSTNGGDTWTDLWGTAAAPVCLLDDTTNPETVMATAAKGANPVAAGNYLRVRGDPSALLAGPTRVQAMLAVEI